MVIIKIFFSSDYPLKEKESIGTALQRRKDEGAGIKKVNIVLFY
jgi:hypothetical protein